MRRAIIATAGTVVALVALLDYKSASPIKRSSVGVKVGGSVASGPTTSTGSATTQPTGTTPISGAPSATTTTTPPSKPSGQFTGQDIQYRYGDIQLEITVSDGKITNISVPQESATDPRSQSINSQAVPILTQEALQAQSLNFDVVSGATFTSDAFAQALQSAFSQAGL